MILSSPRSPSNQFFLSKEAQPSRVLENRGVEDVKRFEVLKVLSNPTHKFLRFRLWGLRSRGANGLGSR